MNEIIEIGMFTIQFHSIRKRESQNILIFNGNLPARNEEAMVH
jgi:hypothetical protein